MKRNPRKLAWTKSFRRAHNKEMTIDSTLALSARRNVPVRYNRELVAQTLGAMQRIEEIRGRRERQFYRTRMKGNRERAVEGDRKLVRENQHLLPVEERERAEELLVEDMEGDTTVMSKEEVAMEREERIKEVIRDAERKEAKMPVKSAMKKRRVIVGHGPEKMDVDG